MSSFSWPSLSQGLMGKSATFVRVFKREVEPSLLSCHCEVSHLDLSSDCCGKISRAIVKTRSDKKYCFWTATMPLERKEWQVGLRLPKKELRIRRLKTEEIALGLRRPLLLRRLKIFSASLGKMLLAGQRSYTQHVWTHSQNFVPGSGLHISREAWT